MCHISHLYMLRIAVMPTIRVDDDVYETLRNLGRTGDTFSDVLRPLLGLGEKARGVPATVHQRQDERLTKELQSIAGAHGSLDALEAIVSRYLPPHWADGRQRRDHILSVVIGYLTQPTELPPAKRHTRATSEVAQRDRVTVQTIIDKCGRQLFGVGTPSQMEQFRDALTKIEADWRRHKEGARP